MGSDGASNMLGKKAGLAALIKKDHPEIISVHCLCHRLELAFRDVLKHFKSYEKMMTLLVGIYYFYKRSYKQKQGLLNVSKVLGVKSTLPPKVTGTRWLPHVSRSINNLIKSFRPYEMHLSSSSHQNPKAEGLAKLLVNKEMLAFMLLLQVQFKYMSFIVSFM